MHTEQLYFDFGSPYQPPPLPPAPPDPVPPPSDAPPLDPELAERIARKVARKLLANGTEVRELGYADLVQEGELAIFKARCGYESQRSALSTFMWHVARRAMITRLRQASRHLDQDQTCFWKRRANSEFDRDSSRSRRATAARRGDR